MRTEEPRPWGLTLTPPDTGQPRSTGYPAQGPGRGGWRTWARCSDGLIIGDVEAYLCPEPWDGASGLSASASVPCSQAAASGRLSRELRPLGKGLWTGPLLRSVHQCAPRPTRPQPPAQPCFQEYPSGGSGHSRFQLAPIFREGQDWRSPQGCVSQAVAPPQNQHHPEVSRHGHGSGPHSRICTAPALQSRQPKEVKVCGAAVLTFCQVLQPERSRVSSGPLRAPRALQGQPPGWSPHTHFRTIL